MLASLKERHNKICSVKTDLTQEWIRSILEQGVCQKTGIPFELGKSNNSHRHRFGPSIDRIDPAIAYFQSNCQIVCNMYNAGKGQHTEQEFIEFCHIVASLNPLPDKTDT